MITHTLAFLFSLRMGSFPLALDTTLKLLLENTEDKMRIEPQELIFKGKLPNYSASIVWDFQRQGLSDAWIRGEREGEELVRRELSTPTGVFGLRFERKDPIWDYKLSFPQQLSELKYSSLGIGLFGTFGPGRERFGLEYKNESLELGTQWQKEEAELGGIAAWGQYQLHPLWKLYLAHSPSQGGIQLRSKLKMVQGLELETTSGWQEGFSWRLRAKF